MRQSFSFSRLLALAHKHFQSRKKLTLPPNAISPDAAPLTRVMARMSPSVLSKRAACC